jgi:hypothetical protein
LGSRSPNLRDLDDAQSQYLSRRVPVGIGSKANPALLDGLPSLIKGVSQDFHLVGVESSGKRVVYQYLKQGPPSQHSKDIDAELRPERWRGGRPLSVVAGTTTAHLKRRAAALPVRMKSFTSDLSGGMADSLDEAKAALRAAWERPLSSEKADEICSTWASGFARNQHKTRLFEASA